MSEKIPKKSLDLKNIGNFSEKIKKERDEISIASIIEHQILKVKPPLNQIVEIRYDFKCPGCGKRSKIMDFNKDNVNGQKIFKITCPECKNIVEYS